MWIVGVVALAVVALIITAIVLGSRANKVLAQKTAQLLESGAEPSAVVEWLDSLPGAMDMGERFDAYQRIKDSQLPNAVEASRLVQARELVNQQRSLKMRSEPRCTITTSWFSGCDPKQSTWDICANCSGGFGGYTARGQRVHLLQTNLNSVGVILPVCKWCDGNTEFNGGQYHVGADLRFAVSVHPVFGSMCVKQNVNDFGEPIWSIMKDR